MSVVVRNFLRNLLPAAALAAVLVFGGLIASPVNAGVITVGTPIGSYNDVIGTANRNIGARLRWGANGWEAAIRRSNDYVVSLNPTGAPNWVPGTAYQFEVNWAAATGEMRLSVDFNGGGFGTGETLTVPFNGGGGSFASRVGYGYYGLSIFGNQLGSNATSTITDLSINTHTQADLILGANSSMNWDFRDSTDDLLQNITISGKLTFLTAGTDEERPAWDFTLRSPQAVPEPGSLSLLAVGLAGLVGVRRRRS